VHLDLRPDGQRGDEGGHHVVHPGALLKHPAQVHGFQYHADRTAHPSKVHDNPKERHVRLGVVRAQREEHIRDEHGQDDGRRVEDDVLDVDPEDDAVHPQDEPEDRVPPDLLARVEHAHQEQVEHQADQAQRGGHVVHSERQVDLHGCTNGGKRAPFSMHARDRDGHTSRHLNPFLISATSI